MSGVHSGLRDTSFLVIDRDEGNLTAVGRHLRSIGAKSTHSVESPLSAIELIGDSHAGIDCMICAQDVAPISGLEFLKNLRSGKYGDAERIRGIKFIMLTAHREEALVQAAIKLDVNGYMAKPFDQLTLTRSVHKALAHQVNLKSSNDYLQVDITKANRLQVRPMPSTQIP